MKYEIKMKNGCKSIGMILIVLLCSVANFYAQNNTIEVKGKVINADDGLPIPGVAIVIQGTSRGTVTDFDGDYTILAKVGDVLEFSYLGMDNKAVKVTTSKLDVAMTSNLQDLEEVVVIGYGTVKKRELTGAVSSVKSEDIENIVTSDLGTALQGQAAGVNIVSSSANPGAPSEIIIRGVSSVLGDNTPLWVVDGIMQEGDPGLSPNEIQSIDILKDAASTSIYGARGATGVILVTTKQGTAGSLGVKINSSYGLQTLNREPTRLMNANQQTYFELINLRNNSTLGLADDQLDIIGVAGAAKLQYDTNLYDDIVLNNRKSQNHSVYISGGTKDINFGVTTGFFQKEGVLVNSGFQRFNFRANTRYNHKKWDIRASASIINEHNDLTPASVNQILRYQPNRPDLSDIEPGETIVTLGGLNGTITGWVLESFENERTRDEVRVQTNMNVNYKPMDNLTLSFRYGLSTTNLYSKSFNPFREVVDIFGQNRSTSESSSVSNSALRRLNQSLEVFANYNFSLLDNHNFGFTTVVSFENFFTEQFSARRNQVLDNTIKTLQGTDGIASVDSGPDVRHRLTGLLARVQYDYDGKYLFSSSVRRDAESRFSPANRVGIFPSASFAWNISNENFWKPFSKVVNNFKFRATYGEVGNQRFSDYAYQAIISDKIDYVFGRTGSDISVRGATQENYANELVKWEASIQKNLGLDLSFFKNKLNFTFEYYNKTTRDMLVPVGVAPSAGSANGSVILNVGDMRNSGVELAATYRLRVGGLDLRMNGNFSTNNNKVLKINGLGGFTYLTGGQLETQISTLAEGYEAGAFFTYPTNGVIKTQAELDAYLPLDSSANLGDLIYKDSNGDGVISEADRVYSGSGLPLYQIGYNFNAKFKGIDLSMNWYAALGHKIFNGAKFNAFEYGRHEDLVYQWTAANPTSNIPSYRGRDQNNYQGFTDLWLEDGDYLRLKQITLGYSFSKTITEKMGIGKLRLYVTAQNPLTFTKYTGYDPEVGGGLARRGLDNDPYPRSTQFLGGLQLDF